MLDILSLVAAEQDVTTLENVIYMIVTLVLIVILFRQIDKHRDEPTPSKRKWYKRR